MIDRREYVAEQIAIITGARVALTDAQVERFWALLTREEERYAQTDRHGNYPHTSSVLARFNQLEEPLLHDEIAAWSAAISSPLPRWPNGHRFAACLTHDVDRIVRYPWLDRLRQIYALRWRANPLQSVRWSGGVVAYSLLTLAGVNNQAPYDFWLDEEGPRGFHSTFFVLPQSLEQPTLHDQYYRYQDHVQFAGARMTFTEATRRLQERGWEIGLHGSYASAYNERIMRAEKEQVETMLGYPVSAIRQHYLRFHIDHTPRIQQSAGFAVDSTLGYGDTIGCRAGLAFPYFWPEMDLLEVPLIIHDVALLRNSPRPRNLPRAIERAKALITRIAHAGGVVTLSWHTHPDSSGAHECYRALLDIIADLGGWGCSIGELNAWWRERRAALRPQTMRITI
jgi:hypothetical protein